MNRAYPLRYIATLIWIGFILGISFMEAPLKFQAPSVTLSIGLEIGKLVFGTLNKIEWVLLGMAIISFLVAGSDRRDKVLVALLLFVLMVQTFYLLPVLDARADLIISGQVPDPSNLHLLYIILEIVKVILLGITTFAFIYPRSDDSFL